MTPFELLPAIDLRGGQVVRLRQGDFESQTVYPGDPLEVARAFVAAGATMIHVVDLDGARTGRPAQAGIIARIIAGVGERAGFQVAGGLRSAGAVAACLAVGARRVVLGTAALRDPCFVGRLVERHGTASLVAALDVRDGMALGEGWRAGAAGTELDAALRTLADAGVERFAVTAIERDGLLAGPDLRLLERVVALGRGAIIASGGVSSLDDLRAVRAAGCAGAIVGRALYEGRLDFAEALRAVAD